MEKEKDLSQLIPPLPTNTQGVRRLISAFRSGTAEIQGLLSQECNVILECKICQNLFRSLPNFISHKRTYCLRPAPPLEKILHNNQLPEYYSNIEAIESELGRRDIDQIATRLTKKATFTGPSPGLRGENPEAAQNVAYYTAISESIKSRRSARIEQTTVLKPIPGTSKAVAQTIKNAESDNEDVKSDYEPPNKRSKAKKGEEKSSPVSASGKPALKNGSPGKGEKKKDGTYTVMQYPCPVCKKVFSKPNGTYRHIRDIHKKSNDQLERMKNNIRKKAFMVTVGKKSPRAQTPPVTTTSSNNNNNSSQAANTPQMVQEASQLSKAQQEEQKEWNDHTFTVDVGDHRCANCGMRYERRAALLAHAKQCIRKAKELAAKKPDPKVLQKSKANRKMSAPMKIVRKYLMNASKSDGDDRNRVTNGVKSPNKNLRRSTRSSGSPVPEERLANMFPTIPLTRLTINSSDRITVKTKSPLRVAPLSPLKPPMPVTPIALESIIKSQKSSVSNILVRQVSDKSCLSPMKTPTPAKEAPAVASVPPMLSVKPKDGYPLNYFSPGSAETKLIGSAVPSSIQIRRDYTKTAQVAEEPPESQETRPVIPAPEVPKSLPVLNLDKPLGPEPDEKNQLAVPESKDELVNAVKSLDKEAKEKDSPMEQPEAPQVPAEAAKGPPEPHESSKEQPPPPRPPVETQPPKRLKCTTIVAVPVSTLDKLPNIASALKLNLTPDVLSGLSKVVLAKSAAAKEGKVEGAVAGSTGKSSNDDPKSASREARTVTLISTHVPDVSKLVPAASGLGKNSVKQSVGNLQQALKALPKAVAKDCPAAKKPTIEELDSRSSCSSTNSSDDSGFRGWPNDWHHSQVPIPKKKATSSSAEQEKKKFPANSAKTYTEENGFRGWSKENPPKSLAQYEPSVFFKFHDRFADFVKKIEEVKIVIELEPSDLPLKLPPGVKIERVDK